MNRRFDLNINMKPTQEELEEMFELENDENFEKGMNWSNKSYVGLKFKGKFLEKTQMRNCFFENCDLSDVDFCKIDFSTSIFKQCNLENGMFGMSRFRNCSFIACKLKGVNFEYSNIHQAKGIYIASFEYGMLIGHFERSKTELHVITADGKNGFYGSLKELKRRYGCVNSYAFLDFFDKVVIDNNK